MEAGQSDYYVAGLIEGQQCNSRNRKVTGGIYTVGSYWVKC